MTRIPPFTAVALVFSTIVSACGSSASSPTTDEGKEGGACITPTSSCDAGLACKSGVCVHVGTGGTGGTTGKGGSGGTTGKGGSGGTTSSGGATSTGGTTSTGGSGAGAGPTCQAASHSCTSETDCCSGLHCDQGTCGDCGAGLKFCPKSSVQESTCWPTDVNCASVKSCSGALKGCTGTATVPDCKGSCVCPDAAYPVFCAGKGTVAENCWGSGTVCSTIKDCSGSPKACSSASQQVNCTTNTCESTGGGTGGSGGTCQPGSVDCPDQSSAMCKCGQFCFQGCATCSFRCGWTCQTDADCVQESGGLYKHCSIFSLENRCTP